ncbi:MAG TPA: aromatic ring-hydroxylating dioxygenase subunit alpha [Candidatus Cybelea sp.]|jgi:Rieske 2Fe-2S family protein|nr:aromatic ring-hydroxylating dioxygenase subunit alpha [Candidatus Cybelea sp.]
MKSSEYELNEPNDLDKQGLADRLAASLPRAAYCDAEFFGRERRAIFWDQWFYVGRAEQLREIGAYRVLDVAGESVILIRDHDALHAHLNFCRHRGSRLLCGEGIVRGAIRCPYHAWAYAFDGRLIASPFIAPEAIPAEARRLHRVAVDEWGGFVFVQLSPESAESAGVTLTAQLGAIPERLARYPLAELKVSRSLTYDVAANWKVLLENYNECYHCAGVHPELCRVVPAFKHHGGAELDWENGIPHRDGAWTFTASGTSDRAAFATLSDEEKVRHKGELIYPNFMLSLAADHVVAFSLWPFGPGATTIVCDLLFHPDEIAKSSFDPTDVADFWDLVNQQDWKICESVQVGMQSTAFTHGYYAPMEDASLDIRRYISGRLGSW